MRYIGTSEAKFKNKFETLMHLVGFTIEIYYEALPYERQICLLHVSNIKVFILRKPCTCSFVVFFHAAV